MQINKLLNILKYYGDSVRIKFETPSGEILNSIETKQNKYTNEAVNITFHDGPDTTIIDLVKNLNEFKDSAEIVYPVGNGYYSNIDVEPVIENDYCTLYVLENF